MRFKKFIFFLSLVLFVSFFPTDDCFAETVEWKDFTTPLKLGRYQINVANKLTINVHIPAEILKKFKKLPLIIEGKIDDWSIDNMRLRINNSMWASYNFPNKHPYKFKIKTKHLKPGLNKLHVISQDHDFAHLNNTILQFIIEKSEKSRYKKVQAQPVPKTSKPNQPVLKTSKPTHPIPKTSKPTQPIPETSKSPSMALAGKDKFKIAVMEFKSLNPGAKTTSLGAVIAEMFTTEVVNNNSFKIVEREQLNKVLGELQIGQSGVIDTTDAQKLGKILGAGAIITGSVTKMGNRLSIESRIIEVETGIIVGAERRICKENLTDISRNIADMTAALARTFYKQK